MEFGQKYTIRDTGEVVSTIDVESDGRMKVIGQDGIERLLSVDYLYLHLLKVRLPTSFLG